MQDKQVTPITQTTQPFSSSNLMATTQVGTTQNNSTTPAGTAVTSEGCQQQYTDIYNNPVTNYLKQLGGIEPYPDASSDYVPDNFRPSKGAANTTSSFGQPTTTANPVSINNPASVVSSTSVPASDASSSHSSSKVILLAAVKPGKLPSFAHSVAQPTNSIRDAFCEALIPIFTKGYRTSRATYKRAQQIMIFIFMFAVIPISFLVYYNIYPWFTVPPLILIILHITVCAVAINRRRLFDAGQPIFYAWLLFVLPLSKTLNSGVNFVLENIPAATAQDELPRYLTFFSKK